MLAGNHDYRMRARQALLAYLFLLAIDQFRPRTTSSIEFWCIDLIVFLLVPSVLVWKFRLLDSSGRDQLGISKLHWQDIGLWVLVVLCFVIANFLGAMIGRGISPAFSWLPKYDPYYFSFLPLEVAPRILAVTYLSFTAAFFEEFFFRGIAYVVWMQRPNKQRSFYIFIAIFLFAVIHWRNGSQGIVATLFVGTLAAVVFSKTRDLMSLVMGHFVINWWAQW